MGDRRYQPVCAGAAVLTAVLLLTGCSRSQMNYQIAEAIGTDGKYENNEPVETPRMKQQREAQEQSEADEKSITDVLSNAEELAAGYRYEEAIAALDTLTAAMASDERVQMAREEYQTAESSLVSWEGDIPHLCFPTLIADPSMAFDGDDRAAGYSSSMTTVDEFSAILESLYENNYVLIDIHSIASLQTDESGSTVMTAGDLKLPPDKKPIVLSQDNVDYSSVKNGDGIATRLVLDSSGKVKAVYTDSEGHDLTGDYDFIPVLDSFIEEHPDFSYQGARGIVSVSGSEGVFGYPLPSSDSSSAQAGTGSQETSSAGNSYSEDQQTIAAIASALTDEGWSMACAGWSHSYMGEASMSISQFQQEISTWISRVKPLISDSDIFFFPYGDEVSRPGEDLSTLLNSGFVYLSGLWQDTDFREIDDGYMRMTRRFIDGYALQNNSGYFSAFFNTDEVLDPSRQQ